MLWLVLAIPLILSSALPARAFDAAFNSYRTAVPLAGFSAGITLNCVISTENLRVGPATGETGASGTSLLDFRRVGVPNSLPTVVSATLQELNNNQRANSFYTPSLSAAWIEGMCGITNVTGLVQSSPDAANYADSTYHGVRFRGLQDGVLYEWEVAFVGRTDTRFVNTRTAVPPAPFVTSIAPPSGPTSGGNSVTINGSDLANATQVNFGGTIIPAASFGPNTATAITVTAPPNAAGTVDISVTTFGGTSSTSGTADNYTYVAAPEMEVSGSIGGAVTDAGTSAQGDRRVGVPVTVTYTVRNTGNADLTLVQGTAASPSNVTVGNVTPMGAAAVPGGGTTTFFVTYTPTAVGAFSFNLSFANNDSDENPFNFTVSGTAVAAVPTVTSLNPTFGQNGSLVSINGTNLRGATQVLFGTEPATQVTEVNDTQVTVRAPSGTVGPVNVFVTTPSGTSADNGTNDDFTYVATPILETELLPTVIPPDSTTPATVRVRLINPSTIANTAIRLTVTFPTGLVYRTGTLVDNCRFGARAQTTGYNFSGGTLAAGASCTIEVGVVSGTPGTYGAFTFQLLSAHGGFTATRIPGLVVAASPTVTGVSPNTGTTNRADTAVTITGTNFNGATRVTFGTTDVLAANFTSRTNTQIVVNAPSSATAGAVDVTVTTPGGTSANNGTLDDFTYIAPPVLTSITPDTKQSAQTGVVPVPEPISVTLAGQNFVAPARVVIGGVDASNVTVVSPTQITASVANRAENDFGHFNVQVITDAGTSAETVPFFFKGRQRPVTSLETYTPAGAIDAFVGGSLTYPALTDAGLPARIVLLRGEGTVCNLNAVNLTRIDFVSAGSCEFTIVADGSDEFLPFPTRPQSFGRVLVVNALPTITSISPAQGPLLGGTEITITGSNLFSGSTVTVGGVAATNVRRTNSTLLTATVPQGVAAGPAEVVVTSLGVPTVTIGTDNDFTYVDPPVLNNLSLTEWEALQTPPTITLTGQNFVTGASVTVGGVAATNVVVTSPTTITATFPGTLDVGAVPVSVVTAGGTSQEAISFAYKLAQSVTNQTRVFLPQFTGRAFVGGSVDVDLTVSAGTTPSFVVEPASAAVCSVIAQLVFTFTAPGDCRARLTAPGNDTYLPFNQPAFASYAVAAAPTPTITGVSPAQGPLAGGTQITVTGTNLFGDATVTVGGVAATNVTPLDRDTLTATVPAGTAAGPAEVVVTTLGVSNATTGTDNDFTYVALPIVSGVSPAFDNIAGGKSITISGSNLNGATTVSFGSTDVPQSSFTSRSDTEIVVNAPARAAGTVNVTVTTAGGTSADAGTADDFEYGTAPTRDIISLVATRDYGFETATSNAGQFFGGNRTGYYLGPTGTDTVFPIAGGVASVDANGLVTLNKPTGLWGEVTVILRAFNAFRESPELPITFNLRPPVLVSSLSGTGAQQGVALSGYSISTTGGNAPFTCETTPATGSLPAGVSISADCTLSGTPTQTGSFDFTVDVTDASVGPGAGVATAPNPFTQRSGTLSLAVALPPPPSVTAAFTPSTIPADGITEAAYAMTFTNAAATPVGLGDVGITFNDAHTLNSAGASLCGGTLVTTTPGLVYIVANAVVPANGTCTISLPFTMASPSDVTADATVRFNRSTLSVPVARLSVTAPVPTITAITPAFDSADGGKSITITGKNFTGATKVSFGTTDVLAADFTPFSSTEIVVAAPAGSAGTVNVTVTTPGGTSADAGTADDFTYVGPSLSLTATRPNAEETVGIPFSYTLTQGSQAGGASTAGLPLDLVSTLPDGLLPVSATGTGWTCSLTGQFVWCSSFDTIAAGSSGNPLTISVMPQTAGDYAPQFTFAGGGATAAADVTAASVTVNDVLTAAVSVPSTTLRRDASATPFTPVTRVGGGTAPFTWSVSPMLPVGMSLTSSTGEIIGMPGSLQADRDYTFTITDARGATATANARIAVLQQVPTVDSVTPATGTVAGGTEVTISGANFRNATVVRFGTVDVTSGFTVNGAGTQITVPSPAQAAGTVNVTVTTPGGTSADAGTADDFTYVAPVLEVYDIPTFPALTVGALHDYMANVTPRNAATFGKVTLTTTLPTGVLFESDFSLDGWVCSAVGQGVTCFVDAPIGEDVTQTPGFTVRLNEVGTVPPFAFTVSGGGADSPATESFSSVVVNPLPTLTVDQSPLRFVFGDKIIPVAPTSVTGGTEFYDWSISPALPAGLTFAPDTGEISGIPLEAVAESDYVVTVKDTFGFEASATIRVETVVPILSLTATRPHDAVTVGIPFNYTLTPGAQAEGVATGGPPLDLTGTLPDGLRLVSATGTGWTCSLTGQFFWCSTSDVIAAGGSGNPLTISVMPETAGNYAPQFTLSGGGATAAADATAASVTVNDVLTAEVSVPSTTLRRDVSATPFTPVTRVSGGTAPFSWSIVPAVPTGLSMDGRTGEISGTPGSLKADREYTFTITDARGARATARARMAVLVPVPTVASVSPTTGPEAGGTEVTINGANFSDATVVRFGTVDVTSGITVNGAGTQITVPTPAQVAGTVNVTVTTPGGTSADAGTVDDFTYVEAIPIPSLAATRPNAEETVGVPFSYTLTPRAEAGGAAITGTLVLTGPLPGGLRPVSGTGTGWACTFNGQLFSCETSDVIAAGGSGNPLTISVMPETAGTYAPRFFINSIRSSAGFSINTTAASVTVNDVLTAEVSVPSTTLRRDVSATPFTPVTRVSGGTAPFSWSVSPMLPIGMSLTSRNGEIIGMPGSPQADRDYTFTITDARGATATARARIAVLPVAPTVDSVSPTTGPETGGTEVTINGANFSDATVVRFGTVDVTSGITVNGAGTQITVPSPAQTAGTVRVSVTTPGGTSADAERDDFTYVAVPTITPFTFGTTVAYNTGTAVPITIDVAAGGAVTGAPTDYAVVAGSTTGGGTVSIDKAGLASYTPAVGFRGTDSFGVTASNAGGASVAATISVTVGNPSFVASVPFTTGTVGVAYAQQVTMGGGASPYTAFSATGLPEGLVISADGLISGTPTQAGTFASVTVTATDSSTGTGAFTAAAPALSMTIAQGSQLIAFTAPGPQTFVPNGTVELSATGGASGLPVTFSTKTEAVCSVSGTQATILSSGTCSVTASQAGNANYAAAADVTESFAIGPAAQLIAFTAPGPQTFVPNGTVELSATGGASGLPVTFSTKTEAVCSVSGTQATILSAGTCSVTASQAGNANYAAAADVTESFDIGRAAQLIAFTAPGPQTFVPGGTVELSATGGASGLPVTFATKTEAVCSVSGTQATILSSGTCSVTASQAGNANYAAAADVTESFAIGPAAQLIAFTAPGPQTFVPNGTVELSATGGASGLPVTFATKTEAVCSVSGTQATILSSGTCSVTASQAGNANYAAAADVTESFAIGPAAQLIAFTAPGPQTFVPNGTVELSATGGASGLPVTFATKTEAVCSVSGTQATILSAGTCSVTASQAGNVNYAAAADVTESFDIGRAAQVIAFTAPAAQTFVPNGTVELEATGGASGLPVTFATKTEAVCSVSGTQATILSSGTCSVTASQAGNANYAAAADVTESFAIGPAAQLIAFTAPAAQTFVPNGTVELSATGGASGLPVTFSTKTEAVCSVSGTQATILSAGTCSVTASQAGNANYAAAADVTESFDIGRAAQLIAFTAPGPQVFVPGGTVELTATGGASGLPVTFATKTEAVCSVSGTQATILSAGTCSVTASQAGNVNYAAAADVTESFDIGRAAQVIAFTAPAAQTFVPNGTVELEATGGASGLPVTFATKTEAVCSVSGTQATILSSGTCSVTASQAGNANYAAAADVTESFAIGPAAQLIAFTAPAAQTFVPNGTVELSATGGASGLPVTFSTKTEAVCSVSGTQATILSAGTCSVTASQAGNANYAAAADVTESFDIGRAAQLIAFTAPGPQVFVPGGTVELTATGGASGLPVTFATKTEAVCSVSGTQATILSAGTCSVTASQAGNVNYAAAADVTESFDIGRAAQVIAFTAPAAQTFVPNGTVELEATGGASGLPVTFATKTEAVCSVSGTQATILSSGTCSVTASQAGNANYAAAADVTESFAIGPAAQLIAFTAPGPQVFVPGGTVELTATGGASGLPVTFSTKTEAVCTTVGTNGARVTFVSVGTCAITASQAGNASYAAAADVTETFAIGQASQTITFPDPVQTRFVPGDQITLTATASSGLPVQFKSLTTNACTATTDGTVRFVERGACTVAADQPGDSTFAAAARVTKTLNVEGVDPVLEVELITKMQAARASALVLNQPDLSVLLDPAPDDATALSFSSKGGQINLLRVGGPVWLRLSGSITEQARGARDHYVQLSLGSHVATGPQSILGIMATFDSIRLSDPTGQAEGTGWLIGPYFVTRLGASDVIFEVRALTGMTDDRVAQVGAPFSSVEGKRSLLMAKLSGTFEVEEHLTLSPSMSLASVNQASSSYLAFGGTPIPGVSTSYRQASLGLDLKHNTVNLYGPLTTTGSLGWFMSEASRIGSGQGITYSFGLAQKVGDNTDLSFELSGQRDFENDMTTNGLSVRFESRF
jgi:hypothetical protein